MSITYQEIIEILNKADSVTDSTLSTAEFVYKEFKQCYPQVYIGRPSRFLELQDELLLLLRTRK